MGSAQYGGVQFAQAIDFFRGKLSMPTAAWDDLWGAMHSRAFVVAGAMQADLLADLRQAVDGAIADGVALGAFKQQFKAIAAKHGWEHKGGADWRARVIYDTNMRQAYNAGRWEQLQGFPYWQYRHGHSGTPRPDHLSWDKLVLPKDDPWWRTHFPQNGWGCTCTVRGYTEGQFQRLGLEIGQAPEQGTYQWTNKKTGEVLEVPKGIDPGFDYSVGEASLGRRLTDQDMADWQAGKGEAWERLTPGSWKTYGRPELLPIHEAKAPLAARAQTRDELVALATQVLGGSEVIWQGGPMPVYLNAASLADHIDIARAPMLPLVPEVLTKPDEVWAAFERHKGTGKVELRWRFLRMVSAGKYKGQLLVAQVARGILEAWTFIPVKQLGYVNRQRQGMLVFLEGKAVGSRPGIGGADSSAGN
ncbi:PBECR2 nuclease fold domain-containing protein [Gallaecimonas kandeliae]|uniref:PBECR2 nuclease fold domain-containing protein n=1 Tax=Gallaecimonas kandeliae TaxID=3029055 RepID=UPI0026493CCB|nr:PBECR2 nuclease fold domain-containing protein [Gallaecimonas kandeliae]WKE64344.1 PBECR2 nuclease fold domain-containing protein [Gallaecimonas kandeliae]